MNREELLNALKEARSIESHRGSKSDLQFLGIVQSGDIYKYLYRDEAGQIFCEKKYKKNGRLVSEYEHIFGVPQHLHRRQLMAAGRIKCNEGY